MSDYLPASRVTRIKSSASVAAAARVRELKAEGIPIIDLTVGEPDFDTPDHIKAAAIEAINNGETKYTSVTGTPELQTAILRKIEGHTGHHYGRNQLTIGGGAKQVLYVALMASLNAGDEVIVPAPYWVSYPDMVLANDGTPVIVACGEDTGFKLTPDALAEAITPNTKWLILNAPSNPTGAVYTREELQALGAVLEQHPHVFILTDEIYDEIHFGDGRVTSLVTAAPVLKDRILLVNGVSKAYAMTGWRLGYGVGPSPLIAAMNKLQSQTSSCPSSISQAAAVAALNGDQSFVRDSVEVYRKRRDAAVDGSQCHQRPVRRAGGRRLLRLRELQRRHRENRARRHSHRERPGLHALPPGRCTRRRHPGVGLRAGPLLPDLLRHLAGDHQRRRGLHPRCRQRPVLAPQKDP